MLSRTVAILLFALTPNVLNAETQAPYSANQLDQSSAITITTLSLHQVDNLALLARVWGFVKYHHPRVMGGEVNCDDELFRVMPDVIAARNHVEAQKAISGWVSTLGVPTACVTCAQVSASSQLRPDIDWIRDHKLLGKNLSRQLEAVYRNRPASGGQYYASFHGGGNAFFENESAYQEPAFPDTGYRLLALFRYWNAIEYWFPYRNLIDEDWNDVLREFIPRLVSAKSENDYILDMAGFAARIDDGHAGVSGASNRRPPVGGYRLPAAVRYVEGRFVVQMCMDAGTSSSNGLQVGDSIVALDGMPVEKLTKMIEPYYGASNPPWRRHTMSFSLLNGPAGPCRVTVERNGKIVDVDAMRVSRSAMPAMEGATHDLPGPIFRKLSDDVGYLWHGLLKPENVAACIEQAKGTRCLLIDIRAYPNDFPAFELGAHLVTKPTPHSCFTYPDSTNPGAFVWREPKQLTPAAPHYEGKVAILVDETTLSSAEYSALVLRASPQVIVVGSTTAGADGDASFIPLPGGLKATMSGIGVFYPDHSPTQRVGIVPDLVVHPTIAGIREERDEVAEAAVRHLTGEKITIYNRYYGHH